MNLGIGLRQSPREVRAFISEVPLCSLTYRRAYGSSTAGLFKESLRSPCPHGGPGTGVPRP